MTQTEIQPDTARLFDLTGRVALVAGATGRLGRETSLALAQMGADLVVVARTKENLTALEKEISDTCDSRVLSIAMDLQHQSAIDPMFKQTMEHYGRLDILVNIVTGNICRPVEDINEEIFDAVMHEIVTGMFLCCQGAGRIMTKQGSGSIINIASIYGQVAADQRLYSDSGLNSSVVYGTGKAAVIQMTRYLAAYWAASGIRVNCITPGGVEDATNEHREFRANYQNRTPMQRMMRREEIRGPVIFLASDASSYVTGHNLLVDGGFTIV